MQVTLMYFCIIAPKQYNKTKIIAQLSHLLRKEIWILSNKNMKLIIQRVSHASVSVDSEITGAIDKGYLVLLGVGQADTKEIADKLIKKLINLRIFADENGKTNLSIKQVNGSLLVVSQFTLYADCSHGNRPSFVSAASPSLAEELYEYFIQKCKEEIPIVEHGTFGADMKVELINDGPFTIILE